MKKDPVIGLKKPEVQAEDPLTEVLRRGARQLLVQALEAEIDTFLTAHAHSRRSIGRTCAPQIRLSPHSQRSDCVPPRLAEC